MWGWLDIMRGKCFQLVLAAGHLYKLVNYAMSELVDAFEMLAQSRDPFYPAMLRATETVKGFIAERGLVVYGGTAIDYALRLKGHSIYSDSKLTIPDLDFYATDSVGTAYDLAEILHGQGNEDARSFAAIHSTTMRVDVGDNHWIADISYIPKGVMDRLPTVTYMGMKCVHPDYQRIDMHSSLTFPYDNAPSEVITARWEKDVKRLGKIAEVYPFTAPDGAVDTTGRRQSRQRENLPLAGWTAYRALCAAAGGDDSEFVIAGNAFVYDAPVAQAEYWSDECVVTHNAYAGALPQMAVTDDVIVYSSADRLLSVVELTIGGETVQSVCVNGVLMYLMAKWISTCCGHAAAAYVRLWNLAAESTAPYMHLSASVYGRRNINTAQEISIARAEGRKLEGVPPSYKPANGRRPQFEYVGDLWKQDGSPVGGDTK